MSRAGVDPKLLVAYLDQHTELVSGGHPDRVRRYINGVKIQDHDARIIRRWRSGQIGSVTYGAAEKLLSRYMLTLSDLLNN